MRRPINSYRDLTVWQRAVELYVLVTKLVRSLPFTERMVFEVQMRRAARSISTNISEGHQRRHLGDYLRSLSYARGELGEVETDLTLIEQTVSNTSEQVRQCVACADEVGRMLTKMCARLRQRLNQ